MKTRPQTVNLANISPPSETHKRVRKEVCITKLQNILYVENNLILKLANHLTCNSHTMLFISSISGKECKFKIKVEFKIKVDEY